jgi:5-formyltetrahydrofolate cyclo-ligase
LNEKTRLRAHYRAARREHVASLPAAVRGLLFHRPPALVTALVPEGAVVGLYHPTAAEAPTLGYARWFAENGRQVALPWFAGRDAAMRFRLWADPIGGSGLAEGPWRAQQPTGEAAAVVPDVVFVPLVAFTADGTRLGQGGGHYDRWLAAHPGVPAIGLAWDCQEAEALPDEPHDRMLTAIVTPGRILGPFAVAA